MAKTKFDTPAEKKRLQERGLALKPNVPGVVATARGWEIAQPKGTMEILVRFNNLDELLGDEVSEVEVVGEPITIPEPVEEIESAAEEEVVEEVPAEPIAEAVEEAVKTVKKPGRPKKVAE